MQNGRVVVFIENNGEVGIGAVIKTNADSVVVKVPGNPAQFRELKRGEAFKLDNALTGKSGADLVRDLTGVHLGQADIHYTLSTNSAPKTKTATAAGKKSSTKKPAVKKAPKKK
jgi:hypothetical protein